MLHFSGNSRNIESNIFLSRDKAGKRKESQHNVGTCSPWTTTNCSTDQLWSRTQVVGLLSFHLRRPLLLGIFSWIICLTFTHFFSTVQILYFSISVFLALFYNQKRSFVTLFGWSNTDIHWLNLGWIFAIAFLINAHTILYYITLKGLVLIWSKEDYTESNLLY